MSTSSFSDADLLERFSQGRDEDAFGELVRRHVGWVHSAAARLTFCDAFAAEEVAQDVFADLARKASRLAREVRSGKPLVGWLHVGTRLAASNHRRSTSRRMARENHMHKQNQDAFINPGDTDNAGWDEIRPLIDEALEALPSPDRDAVLMRFFEQRELRSIGDTIGVSEEAARKRINRALDRLREWLGSRGVRTTAAALAIAVTAHGVQPTPAGLASKIAQNAVVRSGGAAAAATGHPTWIPKAVLGTVLIGLFGWMIFQKSGSQVVPTVAASEDAVPISMEDQPIPSTKAIAITTSEVSRSTPTIRIPKSFLEKVSFMSVLMTNSSDRRMVVSKRFVTLFRLTPTEVDAVTAAIDKALHRYRTIEGQRLKPTSQSPPDSNESRAPKPKPPFRLDVLETRSFVLEPFPEESKAIHEELGSNILSILGPQRGAALLRMGRSLQGEMKTFEPTRIVNGITAHMSMDLNYTYRLVELEQGPIVDLQRSSPGGSSGAPYGEELYPYVPEALKPDLARWQEYIEKKGSTYFQWSAEQVGSRDDPEMESSDEPSDLGPWDENSPSMEIPKAWLTSMDVAGLTPLETISEEAIELCELTESETASATEIYSRLKERFLELEKRHFQRSASNSLEFVLHAFPQEIASLRTEFAQSLRNLLGDARGEILDNLIRTPMSLARMSEWAQKDVPGRERLELIQRLHQKLWLELGDQEIHVKLARTQQGWKLEYYFPSETGNKGSTSFGLDRFPLRWRHLLTPEMIQQ